MAGFDPERVPPIGWATVVLAAAAHRTFQAVRRIAA